MFGSKVVTIAALALARAANAAPDAETQPAKRPASVAIAERRALADYQLEVQRIVDEEERAARARDAGQPNVPSPAGEATASRCRLMQPGADETTSRDCVACHSATGRDNHPVDLDYEQARSNGRTDLRPFAEVVRRGLLVPNGELRCVTCHDGRSPWKHKIALPPGVAARPAVNPHDRSTYETSRQPAATLPAGSEVTPKPLCLACHSFD